MDNNIQRNYCTKEPYRNGNQIKLLQCKDNAGFTSNEWITFLQAKSIGLMINKGAGGVKIGTVIGG